MAKSKNGPASSSNGAGSQASAARVEETQAMQNVGAARGRSPAVVDQERLIGMEFIRATEAAALSAYKWMGKGDKESADFAACDGIRGLCETVNISGLVTIGEGIKDNAPRILKGAKLGLWSAESLNMAIALDPMDVPTI